MIYVKISFLSATFLPQQQHHCAGDCFFFREVPPAAFFLANWLTFLYRVCGGFCCRALLVHVVTRRSSRIKDLRVKVLNQSRSFQPSGLSSHYVTLATPMESLVRVLLCTLNFWRTNEAGIVGSGVAQNAHSTWTVSSAPGGG